jgi:hypothetical protein
MDYRTNDQWVTMCENMLNGNWTDAGKNCAEFGFYAGDIRNFQEQAKSEGNNIITDDLDFCELIEIANKYR